MSPVDRCDLDKDAFPGDREPKLIRDISVHEAARRMTSKSFGSEWSIALWFEPGNSTRSPLEVRNPLANPIRGCFSHAIEPLERRVIPERPSRTSGSSMDTARICNGIAA